MCLGIPGRIVKLDDAARKLATVDVSGVKRQVNIACIVDAEHPADVNLAGAQDFAEVAGVDHDDKQDDDRPHQRLDVLEDQPACVFSGARVVAHCASMP